MYSVTALGTSSAMVVQAREHTYLLVEGDTEAYLIDCAGSPIQRLSQIGMPLDKLEGVLITHHHPDHIYGYPALVLGLWLHGRRRPLHVYAPPRSIEALSSMDSQFEWNGWPDWLPIVYHAVPAEEGTTALISAQFRFITSPGVHGSMTSLGVRVEADGTSGTMVYSSDTQPCEAIVRLARGADLLIHEAAGGNGGHSSAAEAGAVARRAQAKQLALIHYPRAEDGAAMIREAQREFSGPIDVADDFSAYRL